RAGGAAGRGGRLGGRGAGFVVGRGGQRQGTTQHGDSEAGFHGWRPRRPFVPRATCCHHPAPPTTTPPAVTLAVSAPWRAACGRRPLPGRPATGPGRRTRPAPGGRRSTPPAAAGRGAPTPRAAGSRPGPPP